MTSFFLFVVGTFAVWRVTHLFNAEDGPANIFLKLRNSVRDSWLRTLFDCFYCLSLWIAVPFAFVISNTVAERILTWLALSGAACLIENWSKKMNENRSPIYWEEEKENDDDLLRKRKSQSESLNQSR